MITKQCYKILPEYINTIPVEDSEPEALFLLKEGKIINCNIQQRCPFRAIKKARKKNKKKYLFLSVIQCYLMLRS